MDSNELITQVDEDDNVIGLQSRNKFDGGKLIHRSSYLIVLDPKRRILLQQRALSKKWHAGKWTFPVAGTVADETYEECIKREIKETFGREISFQELFKYHHFDNVDKAFKTVFIAKIEEADTYLNKGYAANYTWITIDKLKEELNTNPEKYAPPFIAGMKIVFRKELV